MMKYAYIAIFLLFTFNLNAQSFYNSINETRTTAKNLHTEQLATDYFCGCKYNANGRLDTYSDCSYIQAQTDISGKPVNPVIQYQSVIGIWEIFSRTPRIDKDKTNLPISTIYNELKSTTCKNDKPVECILNVSQHARNIASDIFLYHPVINGISAKYTTSHFPADIPLEIYPFGSCKIEINQQHYEPDIKTKGETARIIFHLFAKYGMALTRPEYDMFVKWDQNARPDALECSKTDARLKIENSEFYAKVLASEHCNIVNN